MEKEVAEKISSIQEISTNLKQTLSKIKEDITTDTAGSSPGLTPSDREAISALPETLYQYSQLLNNLSEEWDKLLLTSDGLGTVTSYDGSVFNPQEISLVLVIHCIISDMEMVRYDHQYCYYDYYYYYYHNYYFYYYFGHFHNWLLTAALVSCCQRVKYYTHLTALLATCIVVICVLKRILHINLVSLPRERRERCKAMHM